MTNENADFLMVERKKHGRKRKNTEINGKERKGTEENGRTRKLTEKNGNERKGLCVAVGVTAPLK